MDMVVAAEDILVVVVVISVVVHLEMEEEVPTIHPVLIQQALKAREKAMVKQLSLFGRISYINQNNSPPSSWVFYL
jgi:hypothetical protein